MDIWRENGIERIMTKANKPLVAGNWKMNGLGSSTREIDKLAKKLGKDKAKLRCQVMICPPSTLLVPAVASAKGSRVKIGAQDCHTAASGAHTGDISAIMIADSGASAIIVGHSERRTDHKESNALVSQKATAAHEAGLTAIICIGESEAQHKANRTLSVVTTQLKGSLPETANSKNTVIAYEPVWAIGTGLTPTVDDVAKVHTHIRDRLALALGAEEAAKLRILYGGSVKPDNANELMAVDNVDGALVGGASLKAKDFLGIISAYQK